MQMAMKVINVRISDSEFTQFGLHATDLSFAELLEIVSRELVRQKIIDSIAMAEKFGLSGMSMSDITSEVKATRKNAKDHR